jgi:intron-binding protein aquarius
MVSSYIEVARVKGLKDRKEANFIHGLVQDLIRLLIAYPVDAPIEEEIPDKDDLQTHLRNLLFISKPKFVEDEREFQLSYRRVTKEQLVHLKYYEKFVDFMIQLLSAIPTRKFLKLYLLSQNVLPLLKVTIMQNHSSVLQTLVDLLDHYLTYPIDDLTGEQMTTETQLLIQKDFLKQL